MAHPIEEERAEVRQEQRRAEYRQTIAEVMPDDHEVNRWKDTSDQI